MDNNRVSTSRFEGIMLDKPVFEYNISDAFMIENFLITESNQLETRGGVKFAGTVQSEVLNIFGSNSKLKQPLIFSEDFVHKVDNVNSIDGTFDILKLSTWATKSKERFSLAQFNSQLLFISRLDDGIYYSFNYTQVQTPNSLVWHKLEPIVSNFERDGFIYKTKVLSASHVVKFADTLVLCNVKEEVTKATKADPATIIGTTVYHRSSKIRWCSINLSPIYDINTVPTELRIDDSLTTYSWDISNFKSTAGFLEIPDAVSPINATHRSTDGLIIYLEDGSSYIMSNRGSGNQFFIERLSGQLGYLNTKSKKPLSEVSNEIVGISSNGIFVTNKTSSTTLYNDRINVWDNLIQANIDKPTSVTVDINKNNIHFLYPVRTEYLINGRQTKSTIINLHYKTKKMTVCSYPLKLTAIERFNILSFPAGKTYMTWEDLTAKYNANKWIDFPAKFEHRDTTWEDLMGETKIIFPNDGSVILYGDEVGNVGFLNFRNEVVDDSSGGVRIPIQCSYWSHWINENNLSFNDLAVCIRSVGGHYPNIKAEVSYQIRDLQSTETYKAPSTSIINKHNSYNNFQWFNVGSSNKTTPYSMFNILFNNEGSLFKLCGISIGTRKTTLKPYL